MRRASLLARAATAVLVIGYLAAGNAVAAEQNKSSSASKTGASPAAVQKSTSGAKPTSGHPASYYKSSLKDDWAGLKRVHKSAPNSASKPK